MKQNVHNVERVIRIIAGLAIISLVFIGPQSAWGWLGVIPLATGIIRRTRYSESAPARPLSKLCGPARSGLFQAYCRGVASCSIHVSSAGRGLRFSS